MTEEATKVTLSPVCFPSLVMAMCWAGPLAYISIPLTCAGCQWPQWNTIKGFLGHREALAMFSGPAGDWHTNQ